MRGCEHWKEVIMENRSVAKDEQLKWKEIGGRGWEMVVGGGKRRVRVNGRTKRFRRNASEEYE